MKMLVYQTIDQFEEKQRLKNLPPGAKNPTSEPTYQGMMMEAMIQAFQLDVYGMITNTNYKYIIVKNETKTSNLGQRPGDDQVRGVKISHINYFQMLKNLIKAHTEIMLNPFFELSEGGGVSDQDILECYDGEEEDEDKKKIGQVIGNARYMEVF